MRRKKKDPLQPATFSSALTWTLLAVGLFYLWGVIVGYRFTPGQAKREYEGRLGATLEEVYDFGVDRCREEGRIQRNSGWNFAEHFGVFVNEERMELVRQNLYLDWNGWHFDPYTSVACAEENAAVYPEFTAWVGYGWDFIDKAWLYFRVDDLSEEVTGFSIAYRADWTEGETPDASWWLKGFTGENYLPRNELVRDSRGHLYGAIPFFADFTYRDYLDADMWYLKVELADGTYRLVPESLWPSKET